MKLQIIRFREVRFPLGQVFEKPVRASSKKPIKKIPSLPKDLFHLLTDTRRYFEFPTRKQSSTLPGLVSTYLISFLINTPRKTMMFKYLLTSFAVANAFMPSPSHRGAVTSRQSFGSAIQQK